MAGWYHLWRQSSGRVSRRLGVLMLLGCMLCLSGCNPDGGNTGTPPPEPEPEAPTFVPHGIAEVRRLYHEALLQEDIDRLQALFPPPSSNGVLLVPQPPAGFTDVETFRQEMTHLFSTGTLLGLHIPDDTIHIDPGRQRVTFQEVESVEDPALLAQRTRVFHTTLQLSRQMAGNSVTFRIEGVQRQGPLVEITTLGQVQAEAWTRLYVTPRSLSFARAVVEVPETGTAYPLKRKRGSCKRKRGSCRAYFRLRLAPTRNPSGCGLKMLLIGQFSWCRIGIGCGPKAGRSCSRSLWAAVYTRALLFLP